jgi:hypothetical protein
MRRFRSKNHSDHFRNSTSLPTPTASKLCLLRLLGFRADGSRRMAIGQKFSAHRFSLVGAAIPRPLLLGGFDVAKGVPKPMRAFVPAGAVYFFEADEPVSISR